LGSLSAAVVVHMGGIPAVILGLLDGAQRLMPMTRRRVALGAGSAAGVAGSGTTCKAGGAAAGGAAGLGGAIGAAVGVVALATGGTA
jgi:hypothetical protein